MITKFFLIVEAVLIIVLAYRGVQFHRQANEYATQLQQAEALNSEARTELDALKLEKTKIQNELAALRKSIEPCTVPSFVTRACLITDDLIGSHGHLTLRY